MTIRRRLVVAAVLSLVASMLSAAPASAVSQNDAGTRRDAGNSFEAATKVKPHGYYLGSLLETKGDSDDYYRFRVREGTAISVLVELGADTTDPVEMLDPSGNVVDIGTKFQSLGLAASGVFTGEFPSVVRVAVHKALETGDYRLHLQSKTFQVHDYALCFLNCEGILRAPQDLIFGGSLRNTDTKVLLVPPSHGDLGNPNGPTVLDYVDATLRGMRKWTKVMHAFARDYPQFSYLKKVTVHIEVFDGVAPVDPAAYDVIIGYAAAGPAFRGVASDVDSDGGVESLLAQMGLGDHLKFTGRAIILSLFGSSPRVGQVLYDFPELTDLEIVTTHEFGHTFGLGHTRTWDRKLGPDIMNSPATFIYGDGFPGGDGLERTKMKCLSSLNLYGMATLYRWVPKGIWRPSSGRVSLPKGMPYKWYC